MPQDSAFGPIFSLIYVNEGLTCTTYVTLHAPYTFTLFNSKFILIASPCSASESPSGERTTNVPRSDCPSVDDLGCLDTSSNTFSIDFCNIPRLTFSFQSVEHNISSTIPPFLFLTETQLSVTTDSSPFSVLAYFFYPHFQSKAGCCVYMRNDITCNRAHNLETSEFSSILLRLTKYICALYLPPNSSDYVKFFDYLTYKVDYILFLFSLCWKFHSLGFQCSPPALAFILFHWPVLSSSPHFSME